MNISKVVDVLRGWLLVTGAPILFSGCASTVSDGSDEAPLAAETSELTNGTIFNGTGMSRGAVRLDFWSPVWGEWQFCSGQIVSKRTIVTAAHCVIRASSNNPGQPPPNPGSGLVAAVRQSSSSSQVHVLELATVTALFNPAYLPDVTTPYDVGLFIASSDFLNTTSGDAGLLAKSRPSNVTMYSFGYGFYDEGLFDAAGRFGAIVPTYSSTALEYFFQSTSTQPQMCASDSGGPLKSTTSGPLLVYGLASRRTGNDGGSCAPVGHWAAVANNMAWLRGKISGNCFETSTLYSCW